MNRYFYLTSMLIPFGIFFVGGVSSVLVDGSKEMESILVLRQQSVQNFTAKLKKVLRSWHLENKGPRHLQLFKNVSKQNLLIYGVIPIPVGHQPSRVIHHFPLQVTQADQDNQLVVSAAAQSLKRPSTLSPAIKCEGDRDSKAV